jgi:hypothetical protein
MIFDPVALQTQVNSLPPSWMPYVNIAMIVLMVLGRILTSSANPLTALKAVFMGSVHAATTSSIAAQSIGQPVTIPAQKVVVAPAPPQLPPLPTAPPALTPAQVQAIHAASAALSSTQPPAPPSP